MSTQVGSQGLMLAFSAGVYVYIACTEAAVHATHSAREFPPAKRLLLFLCFAAGAVGIGLVLLDHEHCAPKDADDSGHGH
jgi:zinc transporter ZupT